MHSNIGSSARKSYRTENIATTDLKFKNRSTRKRSEQDVSTAVSFAQSNGFLPPLIADETGTILVGEIWLAAARQLEISHVSVMKVSGITAAQKLAIEIGYHKILENEGWDDAALKDGIRTIYELDCNFDFASIGFGSQETDVLLFTDPSEIDENMAEAVEEDAIAVSKKGDVWILGPHVLINESSTESETYGRLMEDRKARMVFSDPPYNVKTQGHIGGAGKVKHREFLQAAGEMSSEDFAKFLTEFIMNSAAHLVDGALLYICMDFRHLKELLAASEHAELVLLNLCVWCKNNGGMGSFYRSQHELILVFRKGKTSHINNIELGRHGRYRTNVWNYDGVNTFKTGRMDELSMHPTVKPVAMVADAILDSSKKGEYILDPFSGSGTIFIACEKTGRKGLGIELDPLYVDVAVRRWEKWTGKDAVHKESGETFKTREQRAMKPLLALPAPRSRGRLNSKGGRNV